MNQLRQMAGTDEVGVGIKKILTSLVLAKQEEGNVVGGFAEEVARQIAVNKY